MDKNGKDQKASAPVNKLTIAVAVLIVVVIAAAVVVVYTLNRNSQADANNGLTIGYASDASVFLDEKALQAAMDEALRNAQDSNVGLWYRNDAISNDGVNFDCFVGNSAANIYDMFLTIFADADMTDQVFLSPLLRPGTGYETIKLEHALEPGQTTVYVAVTLVDTAEDGTQVIKAQVVHTMDFYYVTE